MYCPHFHLDDRDCSGQCTNCPYGFTPFPPTDMPFNYECPDCHGKFNSAAVRNLGGTNMQYVCPFCGKIMRGLS